MDAFWAALVAVFIAELGDKTQLVALSMSTRFNWRVVMAGVFCATLAVHVVSTGLGGVCGELLNDRSWINYLAGLAFIGFGLWTLRGDSLDDDCECKGRSPFWIVACTFFLAELGDKTMLSTAVVAAGRPFFPVWIGSTVGMVLSDGLAVWVGQALHSKLPERPIKIGAALIFFGFGIYSTISGGMGLSPRVWAITGAVAAGLAVIYLLKMRQTPKRRGLATEEAALEAEEELVGSTDLNR